MEKGAGDFKIRSRDLFYFSWSGKERLEHALIQCRPLLLLLVSCYLIMGFFGGYHTESGEGGRE